MRMAMIGSKPINEKIAIIKRHLNANEEVFGNSMSRRLFETLEDAFRETKCPTLEELNEIDSLEHSKAKLEEYYRESFKDEFTSYLSSIAWA